MTCKDCEHYFLCANDITNTYEDCKNKNDVEKRCLYFKDKARIIDLPRKHGENVYFIKSAFSVTDEPIKATIVGISIMSDGAIYFNSVTENSGICRHFYSSAIGKAVFLTREKAEKALEDIKKNG